MLSPGLADVHLADAPAAYGARGNVCLITLRKLLALGAA